MTTHRIRLLSSMIAVFATMVLAIAGAGPLSDSFTNWLDHAAIKYRTTPPRDPVAELNRKLLNGSVQLTFDGPAGYLRSVLNALHVSVDSQIAVFAKDSVQQTRISMGNPRTLFFNDSVAVGWVRGGFVELAAQDPQQGVVFYVLDQKLVSRPQFKRSDGCLSCHYSYGTVGVPGMLVRSTLQFTVDHTVPLPKRWGGWYVTGHHGSIRDLGNADVNKLFETPLPSNTFNWQTLEGKFDTTGYLSTQSDIVALMVFEHQMHLMNLLSRIGWEARIADFQKHAGMIAPSRLDDHSDAPVQIDAAAKEVVDYMLFVDEAPLADKIVGSSGFSATFSAQGPLDSKGPLCRECR